MIECGCDISWRSLRRVTPGFPGIQTSPAGPLPFRDRAFDLILAIFVLHFPLPSSVLTDLARVSDGIFVGTTYGVQSRQLGSALRDAGFSISTYAESAYSPNHFVFSAISG